MGGEGDAIMIPGYWTLRIYRDNPSRRLLPGTPDSVQALLKIYWKGECVSHLISRGGDRLYIHVARSDGSNHLAIQALLI